MLGKTHAAIGAMSGVLLMPYMKDLSITHIQFMDSLAGALMHFFPHTGSVGQDITVFDQRLSEVTAVGVSAFAAYVPDLDHSNSKLSREIAPITIGNRKFTFIILALAIWYITYLGYLPIATGTIFSVWLGLVAFMKHRGVTHSIVGLFLSYAAVLFLDHSLATAFGVGYASHIVADMLTDHGVPLLWPLKIRLRIPTGLKTGSIYEKAIQLLCGGMTALVLIGMFMGVDVTRYISIYQMLRAQ